MPVAAVPAYLPSAQFKDATPAMRFGLLLPVWTTFEDQERELEDRAKGKSREAKEFERYYKRPDRSKAIAELVELTKLPDLWEKNDAGAREAWSHAARLTKQDHDRMKALAQRQRALAATIPENQKLCLEAVAAAPFTTGLGNEHPLENGFSFLNPHGLPYLPASGVKGVLRQAARELAQGIWGETQGWSAEAKYPLMAGEGDERKPVLDSKNQPVMLSMLDVLFGRETPEGESEHVRGALTFWDAIPQIEGNSLLVEVMTPHQSHYYQQDNEKGVGSVNPHDSGQPTPICFLTVPPGSSFFFCVTCDLAHLRRLAQELAENDRWKQLMEAAFKHAFAWLGFGAKTAVGYGAMAPKTAAAGGARPGTGQGQPQRAAQTDDAQQQSGTRPAAPAAMRWDRATLEYNAGQRSVMARFQGKQTAPLREAKLDEFLKQLGEERAAALKQKRKLENVAVLVEPYGNMFTLLGLAKE